MKNILLTFVLSVALISCTSTPDNPQKSEQLPKIFPDYIGVTIPTNIAPLDFNYAGGNFDCMDVTIKGVKEKQLHSNGEFARFNIDDWHEMVNSLHKEERQMDPISKLQHLYKSLRSG